MIAIYARIVESVISAFVRTHVCAWALEEEEKLIDVFINGLDMGSEYKKKEMSEEIKSEL